MNESEVAALAQMLFIRHGLDLDGWTFEFADLREGMHGFCHTDTRRIEFARDALPCSDRNARELVLHEIAHALCGHGEHNLAWWDKLIDIGGRGVWVEHPERIKSIGIQIVY